MGMESVILEVSLCTARNGALSNGTKLVSASASSPWDFGSLLQEDNYAKSNVPSRITRNVSVVLY
jgi:hypothetical protein